MLQRLDIMITKTVIVLLRFRDESPRHGVSAVRYAPSLNKFLLGVFFLNLEGLPGVASWSPTVSVVLPVLTMRMASVLVIVLCALARYFGSKNIQLNFGAVDSEGFLESRYLVVEVIKGSAPASCIARGRLSC